MGNHNAASESAEQNISTPGLENAQKIAANFQKPTGHPPDKHNQEANSNNNTNEQRIVNGKNGEESSKKIQEPSTKKIKRGYSYFRQKANLNHLKLDLYELNDQDLEFLSYFNVSSHSTIANKQEDFQEQIPTSIKQQRIQTMTEGMMERLIVHFEKKSTRYTTATKEEIRQELPEEFAVFFKDGELDQFYEYWRSGRESLEYYRLGDPTQTKEICPLLRRYWRASADEKGHNHTFRNHPLTRMNTRKNARPESEIQEKLMQMKNEFQKSNELALKVQLREYLKREIAFVEITDFNSTIPGLTHQFQIKNKFCSKQQEIKQISNFFVSPKQNSIKPVKVKKPKKVEEGSKELSLSLGQEQLDAQNQSGTLNISLKEPLPIEQKQETQDLLKEKKPVKSKKKNSIEPSIRLKGEYSVEPQESLNSSMRNEVNGSQQIQQINGNGMQDIAINKSNKPKREPKNKQKAQKDNNNSNNKFHDKNVELESDMFTSSQNQENHANDLEASTNMNKVKQESFQAPQKREDKLIKSRTQKDKFSKFNSTEVSQQNSDVPHQIIQEQLQRDVLQLETEKEISKFLVEFLIHFNQQGIPITPLNSTNPEDIIETNAEMQHQNKQKLKNQNVLAYLMRKRIGMSNRVNIDRLCTEPQQLYGEHSGGINYLYVKSKNEVIYNTFDSLNEEIIRNRVSQPDGDNISKQNSQNPNKCSLDEQGNKQLDLKNDSLKKNVVARNPFSSNSYFSQQQEKYTKILWSSWEQDNMIKKKRKIGEDTLMKKKENLTFIEKKRQMIEEYDSDTPFEVDEQFKKTISGLKKKIDKKQKEKEKLLKMQQRQIQEQQLLLVQKIKEDQEKQRMLEDQLNQQTNVNSQLLMTQSLLEDELDENNPFYYNNNNILQQSNQQFDEQQNLLDKNYLQYPYRNSQLMQIDDQSQNFNNQVNPLDYRREEYDQSYLMGRQSPSHLDPALNEQYQLMHNNQSQIFNLHYQQGDAIPWQQQNLPLQKQIDEELPNFFGENQYTYNQDDQDLLFGQQQQQQSIFEEGQQDHTSSLLQQQQQDNQQLGNQISDINDYLNDDDPSGYLNHTSHQLSDDL